ncbi:discoidin domain-containing protein [Nocardioides panacisoli]|uniref:NAD glycohydrolase translocation F5/8 type C domain-containing protein n=1 Tax=Nocardioides panacisoli TaxID=627624 RepID=A0ABP7I980_9ACTN
MHCLHCGAALGVGRFCTNCGQPIPGRHEGVPAAPPPPPAPPAPAGPPVTPPPTRYPLYVDSPPGPRPTAPPTAVVPVGPPVPPPAPPQRPSGRGAAPWLLWAVLGLAAVLVVGIALVVVLGGGDDDSTAKDPGHRSQPQRVPSNSGPTTSSPAPTSSAPASTATVAAGPARDLASVVRRVQVPGTAAASTDARTGAPVTFEAAHLTDGDPTTCWRVDGDASGTAITITFAQPVTLTEVGLVNGYAKSYPGYDGYRLNRRVTSVRWVLDDGTTVEQQLASDRRMQTVPVQAGETSHLQLEIVSVSPPGAGPLGKDFTPISELDLTGSTS